MIKNVSEHKIYNNRERSLYTKIIQNSVHIRQMSNIMLMLKKCIILAKLRKKKEF